MVEVHKEVEVVVANTPGKVNRHICHPLCIFKGVATRLGVGGHNYIRLLGGLLLH